MESQPQNTEFRTDLENFHPCDTVGWSAIVPFHCNIHLGFLSANFCSIFKFVFIMGMSINYSF